MNKLIIFTLLLVACYFILQAQSQKVIPRSAIPFLGTFDIVECLPFNIDYTSKDDQQMIAKFVHRQITFTITSIICNYDTLKYSFHDSIEICLSTDKEYQDDTRGSSSHPMSFSDFKYKGKRKYLADYLLFANNTVPQFGEVVVYFDSANIFVDWQSRYFILKKK